METPRRDQSPSCNNNSPAHTATTRISASSENRGQRAGHARRITGEPLQALVEAAQGGDSDAFGRLLALADVLRGQVDVADDGTVTLTYEFNNSDSLRDWRPHQFHPSHRRGKWCEKNGRAVAGAGRGMIHPAIFAGAFTLEIDCALARATKGPLLPGIATVVTRRNAKSFHVLVQGLDGRAYIEQWSTGKGELHNVVGEVKKLRLPSARTIHLKVEQTGRQIAAAAGTDQASTIRIPVDRLPGNQGNQVALWALEGPIALDRVVLRGKIDPKWLESYIKRNRRAALKRSQTKG